MSDIVEQLREFVGKYDCPDSIVEEAADEIERLRGIEQAARALHRRREEGPSEDANIFGEWDDLEDALAASGNRTDADGQGAVEDDDDPSGDPSCFVCRGTGIMPSGKSINKGLPAMAPGTEPCPCCSPSCDASKTEK